MDIVAANRRAWDRQVEKGNRWTVPVAPEPSSPHDRLVAAQRETNHEANDRGGRDQHGEV